MKGKLGLDILELAIFSLFFPNVKIWNQKYIVYGRLSWGKACRVSHVFNNSLPETIIFVCLFVCFILSRTSNFSAIW
jgi:hypothetical protein